MYCVFHRHGISYSIAFEKRTHSAVMEVQVSQYVQESTGCVSYFAPSRDGFLKDNLKGAVEVLAWRKHSEEELNITLQYTAYSCQFRDLCMMLCSNERVDGSGNQGL